MNPWQMAQQLKHELATVEWPGTENVVFGPLSVLVYAGALTEDQHPPAFPFALVTIGPGTADPDDPDLIEQTFNVLVATEVAGDPLGEHAVIGGARAAGSNANAGIAEVAERVRAAVERLTFFSGGSVVISGQGSGTPATLGKGRHVVFDEYRVTAWCTSRPVYTAPQELRLVGDTWSWRGEQCAARYDFLEFRLGFLTDADADAVESAAELDGTIYTGDAIETSVLPVPGRLYQLFAVYGSRGAAEAVSEPLVGSTLLT